MGNYLTGRVPTSTYAQMNAESSGVINWQPNTVLTPVENSAVRVISLMPLLRIVVTASPGRIAIQFTAPNPVPNNQAIFSISNVFKGEISLYMLNMRTDC
jgi:hypothetical protein